MCVVVHLLFLDDEIKHVTKYTYSFVTFGKTVIRPTYGGTPPSGQLLDPRSRGHGFDSHHPSCLEVSGKLAILHCHWLCTSNGYLPEQAKMTSKWLKLTAYLNDVFAASHQNTQGDKVIILTHTYQNKPLRKIKVTVCIYQADSPLNVWPEV